MGLLDGEISALFGAVFGAIYLDGVLTRITTTSDGEGGGSVAPDDQPIKMQVDACTEAMRGQPGYTARDMRVLILQASVPGGQIDTDCRVTPSAGAYAGTTFLIGSVTTDPASSYWECRGTPQ